MPGGLTVRLSWKFRLSWKLLAAIVALFFHISHMFHDIVTVVDYRCEMAFRVTAARPPLGCGHPGPVEGATPTLPMAAMLGGWPSKRSWICDRDAASNVPGQVGTRSISLSDRACMA
jgi:hypothetical protein